MEIKKELEFIVSSLMTISYHFECISLPPDVLGSAVGWAGVVRGTGLGAALETWRQNPSHFSLGVCNGCQLMALLGWLDPPHHHGQYFSSLLQCIICHNRESAVQVWEGHNWIFLDHIIRR